MSWRAVGFQRLSASAGEVSCEGEACARREIREVGLYEGGLVVMVGKEEKTVRVGD